MGVEGGGGGQIDGLVKLEQKTCQFVYHHQQQAMLFTLSVISVHSAGIYRRHVCTVQITAVSAPSSYLASQ